MGNSTGRHGKRGYSVVLPFSVAPVTRRLSDASAGLVSDAFQSRPTMFTERVASYRLHQLFRGAALWVLFGLCLSVGLVASFWCSPSPDDSKSHSTLLHHRALKRWLAIGLGVNWGIGIPLFLAVIGSGVKVLKHGLFSVEIQARATASQRWLSGLMALGAALTIWQCLWWAFGARTLLLARRDSRTNSVFYLFCLCCITLLPLVLIAMKFQERKEQATAMKGTAARIVLMGPRTSIPTSKSGLSSSSDDSDKSDEEDGVQSDSTRATDVAPLGSNGGRRFSGLSSASSTSFGQFSCISGSPLNVGSGNSSTHDRCSVEAGRARTVSNARSASDRGVHFAI